MMEILYGLNPVIEAVKSGRRQIKEIIVARDDIAVIRSLAGNIPVRPAKRQELEELCGTQGNQGIAARASAYNYCSLAELARLDCVLLLDSVEDPQNLGAIIRSAHALACAGIVIPENRSAAVTPSVVKASAGAAEHACVARVKNLRRAAQELKKAGFWLVGLEAGSPERLSEVPDFGKIGIIMGGEDSGIRPVPFKSV